MTIPSGEALRDLIAKGHFIEQIVHFGVKQVFGPGISNYTCILIMSRQGRGTLTFEEAGPLEAWRYGKSGPTSTIPSADLNDDAWQFADPETRALFDRVRAAVPDTLGSSRVSEILVGVQTSADKVYIVHPVKETAHAVTCRWNDRDWPIERGIVRPCLHDAPLNAYKRVLPNAWLIFPYDLVADNGGRVHAKLIQPADFKHRFPKCWGYINARKAELTQRSIEGGTRGARGWYQYGRSQSLTKFDTPKIILPVLSTEPRYSYDDANTMITAGGNGPYYMVRPRPGAPVSNFYLLAVLNHPLSEAFIRKKTSTFRGGYYSHGKQFIENLPVPIASNSDRSAIEALVAELVTILASSPRIPYRRTLKERTVVDLKTQIETRVSQLFGLSAADTEVIRAVPIPE